MKAIVTGMIGSYPVGGVVWDYAQYALGLERLGFEVYYLEDTGWQTYDPSRREYVDDPVYAVKFLQDSLAALSPSLGRRWHFRNSDGRTWGVSREEIAEVVATADLFLNVSGGTLLRDDYMACKRKVLIDSDPGWNHFRNYPRWDANPGWHGSHGYRAHDFFFTYAEAIGSPGCILPDMGITWQPTRPLVVKDLWDPAPPGRAWTTVMTWKNFQESIQHAGVTYGTKEMEFWRILNVPRATGLEIEVATGGAEVPRQEWERAGWRLVDAARVSDTHQAYRDYVQSSRGELSVAKNVYVGTGSGWFSCRSVCYLAAGRPVVLQDTGFSEFIPTGEGLLAFRDHEGAARCLRDVESDYPRHQAAARELALTCFDSSVVLGQLLGRVGL